MCIRIRLLLLIHSFISSFFFLSNFQHWNFLSHVDSGQMYHVYQNQAAAAYCPFIFSFFLSLQISNWNFSSHFSRELWGLEDWKLVHTWTVGRCIMYTRFRLLLLIHSFIVAPALAWATKACKFPSVHPSVHPSINIYPGCLVSATPLTVLYQSFWNFAVVFIMVWGCACGLDIIVRLFFVTFSTLWT